jgi:hypothetical protein
MGKELRLGTVCASSPRHGIQQAVLALSPSWLGPARVCSADRKIPPETNSQKRCTAKLMVCPLHWEGNPRFSLSPRVLQERGRQRLGASQRQEGQAAASLAKSLPPPLGAARARHSRKQPDNYGGRDHGRGKLDIASLPADQGFALFFRPPPTAPSPTPVSPPDTELPAAAQLQRPSELSIHFSSGAARIHPPNEDAALQPHWERSLDSRHRSNTKIARGALKIETARGLRISGSFFQSVRNGRRRDSIFLPPARILRSISRHREVRLPSRCSLQRHGTEMHPAFDFVPISPHCLFTLLPSSHVCTVLCMHAIPRVPTRPSLHQHLTAVSCPLPAAGSSRSFETVRERIRRSAVEFETRTRRYRRRIHIEDGGCRVVPCMRSAENGNNAKREGGRGAQTPRQH